MTSSIPTPAEIDQAAKEFLALRDNYLQAKLAATEAQQQMELKSELLKDLVEKHGGPHAEKSKIVHGVNYECVVTFGQMVSVDAVAVENFRAALKEAKQTRLLKKIFDVVERVTLKPGASQIVRGEKLSAKLLNLFAKCEVIKAKTPSLQVRLKEAA